MALEGVEELACADIPQTHCLAFTATGEDVAIRTEGDRSDPVGVSLEGVEALTSGHIPQAHRLILTATS
jgi:hypothetical protein